MFRNIVIGLDGREGGHRGIALARQLAAEDAEITLANVYGIRTIPGRGASIALTWESEASQALLERERASAGLPGAEILRSSEPSVGRGLQEIAELVKADLIVIGSTHRTGAARMILGDDTAAVLHCAPCAVAVAPLDYEGTKPLVRIGVGFDDSPESSRALVAARALADGYDGRLQVRTVVPVNVRPFWEQPPKGEPEIGEMELQLSEIRGLEGARVQVVEGDPAEQLELWSEELDLLVLGTRSRGFIGRAVGGSVVADLAMHSACPLLISPRSAVHAEHLSRGPKTSSMQS